MSDFIAQNEALQTTRVNLNTWIAAVALFMASKASASGLASLDENGKIPTNQLPAIAINDTWVVASQVAMLALTAQRGDVAIRSDQGAAYVLSADDPTVLANWIAFPQPTVAVLSVQGRTGAVTLGDLFEALANKGAASGYASLNAGSLVVQDPANATATPTASKIVKADANGKLPAGWGGAASTVATLDANSLVVQDPANATATPTASKIPKADANAHLDGWISDAASGAKGLIKLSGQIGGSATSPSVTGITETGGPQALTAGAIADGQYLKRSGNNLVGVDLYDALTFTFDNGSSAIAAGTIAGFYVPFACTIIEWTIGSIDATSGSIVFDLWTATQANFPPTVASTITASAKPTVSSATKGQSSTLTGWTIAVPAGVWLFAKVDSCTSIKKAVLTLKVKL